MFVYIAYNLVMLLFFLYFATIRGNRKIFFQKRRTCEILVLQPIWTVFSIPKPFLQYFDAVGCTTDFKKISRQVQDSLEDLKGTRGLTWTNIRKQAGKKNRKL